MARPVLLLGGTAQAIAFARRAVDLPDVHLIFSLAGRTRSPVAPPGEVRVGGFGGVEALVQFIGEHRIAAVIDATHPFAVRISANAAVACAETACPRLVLCRPAWTPIDGDRWRRVASADAAATALPSGARALLTTGHRDLPAFAGRDDVHFLVRLIEPPVDPLPFADATLVLARGPFALDGERTLMAEHEIDTLVTKNSGGDGSRAKLDAARERGIDVIMIERPPPPPGKRVGDIGAALAWLAAQH
ncbi:MAG: cobalt-precorrin-6A reductase [Alphaproteobacteria bacterium]|nr:cobalt-precorrin-6A reductase [Alphaproteobacteria bacterium]